MRGALEGREMVERRAHRHRVGVVTVVHEDDPVGELDPLAPEPGEAYVRSADGHLLGVGAERDAAAIAASALVRL